VGFGFRLVVDLELVEPGENEVAAGERGRWKGLILEKREKAVSVGSTDKGASTWSGGIKRDWQERKSNWERSAGSPGSGIAGQISIETIGNQLEAGVFMPVMTPDLSTHINHIQTDGQQADTK